jgi:hypothetical protein
VLAAAELRLPRVFHPFCSGCHKSSNPPTRPAGRAFRSGAAARALRYRPWPWSQW